MQIKSFYLNTEGRIEQDLSPERLKEAREDPSGLLWLDVYDPDFECEPFLADEMGFHPLAIGDAFSRQHQPAKVDDYGSHLFMIVHGIDYSSQQEYVETARLSMFVAEALVVTVHRVQMISFDAIIQRIERDTKIMERPASLFSYIIFDSLHDAILPTLDHLSDVAAGLEEVAIDAPGREVLQQILQLKRSTIRIQRTMAPQIRVFNRLSRNEFPLIEEEAAVYFRDLQDQIIQLDVINQGVRDTADNALATYLSSIGIKQNETMRVLAIVAAVFLPLSLLAGIYGMNFTNIPELDVSWGYFAVIGLMAVVGLSTFYWLFARKLILNLRRSSEMIRSIKPPMEHVTRMMSPMDAMVNATDTAARNLSKVVTDTITGQERKPR